MLQLFDYLFYYKIVFCSASSCAKSSILNLAKIIGGVSKGTRFCATYIGNTLQNCQHFWVSFRHHNRQKPDVGFSSEITIDYGWFIDHQSKLWDSRFIKWCFKKNIKAELIIKAQLIRNLVQMAVYIAEKAAFVQD